MAHPPTYNQGNQSSIFARLDPDHRKKLDRAIVERQPATLQLCYREFGLSALGVSRAAFYRYARRLRNQAELHTLAKLVHPDDSNPKKHLPRMINERLLDMLLCDEDASALDIYRLTKAAARTMQG